jgi:hypothetical protein
LSCADGPAQLAEDGLCVLCKTAQGTVIVNLASGKQTVIDVPAAGARLAGTGAHRVLVWADTAGVWSSPPGQPKKASKVAPDAPARAFLPSPDASRAVGVYPDEVYTDAHHKKPSDVLSGFALDGQGARRKGIARGVPLEWSHDSQWVLVQDGASACLMKAMGGEYKCWKGYTAVSIASDGRFALVLGSRDKKPAPPAKKPDKKPAAPAEPGEDSDGGGDGDDVAVAPPNGPLSLFRVRLEGSAFTEPPVLVAKVVDGAAVWVPASK